MRHRAAELGFDACGITTSVPPGSGDAFRRALAEGRHGEMSWLARNADRRTRPDLVLPGVRSVVLVAASYGDGRRDSEEVPSPGPGRSTGLVARYARHADYHEILAPGLTALAGFIEAMGPEGSRAVWYTDTGPVLERDLGQRAGLGFVGKHTGLISRHWGNWFLIGEVLTTVDLAPDRPERNHCGRCTRCLDACPTGALPAPFTLDARRCISYLTIELKGSIPEEYRPLVGNRIFGCDDCLAACPWNRFAREGARMRSAARPDLGQPDLVEWLGLDEPSFRARFRGTPLFRTKRRGVLRNVCVALGNVGTVADLPALQAASGDAEPLVAEHAEWAIGQIRRRESGSGSGTTGV
ncbi:MAG: tRNA epoxyqueuosine(34) reductase QueG [Verrucomicrobiales bacterium]|nr:tRNA epoxyqueuosine(34) reductase QueG [Verrucomicrobiales bacterium]